MEWLMDCIKVCENMGIGIMLVPFFGDGDIRGDESGTQAVIDRFKEAAPKAERAGVSLAIESWLSADEHLRIIEAVGSEALKVYYDVGNSDKAGYDIVQEIRRLGDHICEFHAKDYQDLYGKGNIRFKEIRKAMDDIGYRGWFVIEGTKFPLGREESIRYDVNFLRSIFPRDVD
jgi:sugar phosphate isomerase/epimerase